MLGRSGSKCSNLHRTYSDSADVAMSLQVANGSNVCEPHLTHSSFSSSVLEFNLIPEIEGGWTLHVWHNCFVLDTAI